MPNTPNLSRDPLVAAFARHASPKPAPAPATIAERSRRVCDRAAVLLAEGNAGSLSEALFMADRELNRP